MTRLISLIIVLKFLISSCSYAADDKGPIPLNDDNFMPTSLEQEKRIEKLESAVYYLSKTVRAEQNRFEKTKEMIDLLYTTILEHEKTIKKQSKIIDKLKSDLKNHTHHYYLSTNHGGLGPKTTTTKPIEFAVVQMGKPLTKHH